MKRYLILPLMLLAYCASAQYYVSDLRSTNVTIYGGPGASPGFHLSSPWLNGPGSMLVRNSADDSVVVSSLLTDDGVGLHFWGYTYVESGVIYSTDFIGTASDWAGSNAMWQALSPHGITITQRVTDLVLGSITNLFSNGLLVASGPYISPHGPSWIWPNTGHILWPNNGYILLP